MHGLPSKNEIPMINLISVGAFSKNISLRWLPHSLQPGNARIMEKFFADVDFQILIKHRVSFTLHEGELDFGISLCAI